MIAHVDAVYLYTGSGDQADDCEAAAAWLQEQGVVSMRMHYGDPVQHPAVFEAARVWVPDAEVTAFPFVYYVGQKDDETPFGIILQGLAAIEASALPAEYALGRTPA